MRKRHPRQQNPFSPSWGRVPIFVYSHKERYDTTTASKASNQTFLVNTLFFPFSSLPDSQLAAYFSSSTTSIRPLLFEYRLTRPPESNRSKSFTLFSLCSCVQLARLSLNGVCCCYNGVLVTGLDGQRRRREGKSRLRMFSLPSGGNARRVVKVDRYPSPPTNGYKKQHQHHQQQNISK